MAGDPRIRNVQFVAMNGQVFRGQEAQDVAARILRGDGVATHATASVNATGEAQSPRKPTLCEVIAEATANANRDHRAVVTADLVARVKG